MAICHSHGQRGSTGYLFHVRQFLTVPEYNQRYADAGPASKKGATLISVLRTGALGGLHYYSVALEFSDGGYQEWFGAHRFDRTAASGVSLSG